MIGIILGAALAAQGTGSALTIIDGRCVYPGDLPKGASKQQLIPCDSVVISPGMNNGDLLVQFTSKAGGTGGPVGFAGTIDGDTMIVRRIYPTAGKRVAALSGKCRVFYAGDAISGITCVGRTSTLTFVGNFEADGS